MFMVESKHPTKLIVRKRWWRILKRTSLIIILFTAGIMAATVGWVSLNKEKIIHKLITFANEKQSGEFQIGNVDLSWFRYFPDVALEVNNLNYFEHPTKTRIAQEQPIIHASTVYINFNLWTLFRDSQIEVSDLDINSAELMLREDSTGVLNITKALTGKGTGSGQAVTINLHSISLESVMMTWESNDVQKPFALLINQMSAQLDFRNNIITAKLNSDQVFKGFKIFDRYIEGLSECHTDINATYDVTGKLLTIASGVIQYNKLTLSLQGFYDHLANRMIDFSFESTSSEMEILKTLIHEDILEINKNLLQHGRIQMTGKVFGKLMDGNPQVEVSMIARNINIELPDQLGEFKNVGFEGFFHSGEPDDFSEAVVSLHHVSGKIPGGSMEGNFQVKNFVTPTLRFHLNASAHINQYDRIFKLKNIKDLKGHISLQSDFEGVLDLSSEKPTTNPVNAMVTLDKLGFTLNQTNKRISDISGQLVLANRELALNKLRCQFEKSTITVNGNLINPYLLLFKQEGKIQATLNVQSDPLFITDFISDTTTTTPTIDKAVVKFDAVFMSTTSRIRNAKLLPNVEFQIKTFTADFETAPDISQLKTSGIISADTATITLKLNDFYCQLPESAIMLQGGLQINKTNTLDFNTSLTLVQVPTYYMSNFIDEFQGVPLKTSDALKRTISADVDLSASLTLNPFSITRAKINNGKGRLCFNGSLCIEVNDMDADLRGLSFRRSKNDSLIGIEFVTASTTIGSLRIPGIGNTSLNVNLKGTENSTADWLTLNEIDLDFKLPKGSVSVNGSVRIPTVDSIMAQARIKLEQVAMADAKTIFAFVQSPEMPVRNQADEKWGIRSADLELSTSLGINPIGIKTLEVRNSQVELGLPDSQPFNTGVFSVNLKDIVFNEPGTKTQIKSLHGNVDFDSVEFPVFGKSPVSVQINGLHDQLNLAISTDLLHAEKEQGTLVVDLSKDSIEYKLKYTLDKVPLEYVTTFFYEKKLLSGPLNLGIDLQGYGVGEDMLGHLKGSFTTSATNILLHGIELDKFLKNYEKSQNFDLLDLGAFVVYGAAGAVITKGGDFAKLLTTGSKVTDQTKILQLVAKGNINQGVLTTEDFAFSTSENRLAFNGHYNVINNNIPGVTIAVVDKNGCSLLDQRFYGEVKKIQHDNLKVAGTLTGSVTNLANAVSDKNCKPFYKGIVKHPK